MIVYTKNLLLKTEEISLRFVGNNAYISSKKHNSDYYVINPGHEFNKVPEKKTMDIPYLTNTVVVNHTPPSRLGSYFWYDETVFFLKDENEAVSFGAINDDLYQYTGETITNIDVHVGKEIQGSYCHVIDEKGVLMKARLSFVEVSTEARESNETAIYTDDRCVYVSISKDELVILALLDFDDYLMNISKIGTVVKFDEIEDSLKMYEYPLYLFGDSLPMNLLLQDTKQKDMTILGNSFVVDLSEDRELSPAEEAYKGLQLNTNFFQVVSNVYNYVAEEMLEQMESEDLSDYFDKFMTTLQTYKGEDRRTRIVKLLKEIESDKFRQLLLKIYKGSYAENDGFTDEDLSSE